MGLEVVEEGKYWFGFGLCLRLCQQLSDDSLEGNTRVYESIRGNEILGLWALTRVIVDIR